MEYRDLCAGPRRRQLLTGLGLMLAGVALGVASLVASLSTDTRELAARDILDFKACAL